MSTSQEIVRDPAPPRETAGRVNQKRRTRAAILAAAVDLLAQGRQPTVAEVADAALVSRATAYRYFPTQEYLLSEAVLNAVPEEISSILRDVSSSDDPDLRLDAVVRAIQERTARQEAAFRTVLRLSLDQPPDTNGQIASGRARRGARRVDWIEQALQPVWDRLETQTREHLIGALSLCMGVEALVVLRDVCGFSPEQAVEICRWAAQAILAAGLEAAERPT